MRREPEETLGREPKEAPDVHAHVPTMILPVLVRQPRGDRRCRRFERPPHGSGRGVANLDLVVIQEEGDGVASWGRGDSGALRNVG